LVAPQQLFWGFFGAFLHRFAVCRFHFAKGGKGAFFLCRFRHSWFLVRFSFGAFAVGSVGLLGSVGLCPVFLGFLL
jgi:hypothetical protein